MLFIEYPPQYLQLSQQADSKKKTYVQDDRKVIGKVVSHIPVLEITEVAQHKQLKYEL